MANIADPCSSDMGEFNDGRIDCEGSSGLGMPVLKSKGAESGTVGCLG